MNEDVSEVLGHGLGPVPENEQRSHNDTHDRTIAFSREITARRGFVSIQESFIVSILLLWQITIIIIGLGIDGSFLNSRISYSLFSSHLRLLRTTKGDEKDSRATA
jgi:hypothetical protein